MLGDHLTAEELAAYVKRVAQAEELLRISDHLAECAQCRETVQQMEANARSSRLDEPIPYETLADFLDEKLDPIERRQIKERLMRSPASAAELADLTRFRNEMNAIAPEDHDSVVTIDEGKLRPFPRRIARMALPLAAGLMLGTLAIWLVARNATHPAENVVRDGGREVIIAQDGQTTGLPKVSDDLLLSIKSALGKGKMEISPAINSLTSDRNALAGVPNESSSFELVAPVATVVGERTPRFSWKAQPKATKYRVRIADLRTGEVVMTGESDGAHTEWIPVQELNPGNVYQWQVEALRKDEVIARTPKPPEPEARFQILATETQQELAETQTQASGSHLIMAIANAKAGLLDDSIRELRAFAQENPGSEIPTKLVVEIEKARGLKDNRQSPIATNGAQ